MGNGRQPPVHLVVADVHRAPNASDDPNVTIDGPRIRYRAETGEFRLIAPKEILWRGLWD